MPQDNILNLTQAFNALKPGADAATIADQIMIAFQGFGIPVTESFEYGGTQGTLLEHFLASAAQQNIPQQDILNVVQNLYDILQHSTNSFGRLLFFRNENGHLNTEPDAVENWVREVRQNSQDSQVTLGVRDLALADEHHYRQGNIALTQPTLLVLSGADATNIKTANTYAKYTESALGYNSEKDKHPDFHSSQYQAARCAVEPKSPAKLPAVI